MSLRVYNTLTGNKEVFEPVRPGKIGIYLCGPTVYKSPHIGHMVGPVIFDAIKRYLTYKGYEVTWVVNITDVEDKLIDASQKTGISVHEIANKYTAEYHECLALLGVDGIDRFPKASEHMPEIIEIVQALIERGVAYAVDGNVWFEVSKDPDYGKLSHRDPNMEEGGSRALEGLKQKRSQNDFALWKAAKKGEPSWDSPWGQGRPGWHIECSAMSMKYLGKTFDMHGGGLDLLFPHHENELAQSESATGQPFVKHWMHNGLTRVRTKSRSGEWQMEDMHASSGNMVPVTQLVEEYGAELIRYFLLTTHYRRPIEFTTDVLAASRKGITTFFRLFERIERLTGQPHGPNGKPPELNDISADLLDGEHGPFAREVVNFKMKFLEMMDDDFNTAGAIGVMHELANTINSYIEQTRVERGKEPDVIAAVVAATQTLNKLGSLLGLFKSKLAGAAGGAGGATGAPDQTLDKVMGLLIQLRKEARQTKNFPLADAIRNGLTEIGISLEDRADGTGWRKG